jgi:hypothetical protein
LAAGGQRKEHRGYDRVSVHVQDPDRSDIGERADELLETLAQFGCVGTQRPLGSSARDLLDAVEGHGDRTEHPQRVFGGKIQRLPDLVIGALECGAVVRPRRIAKQQQRKYHARRQHHPQASKRGGTARSHAEPGSLLDRFC